MRLVRVIQARSISTAMAATDQSRIVNAGAVANELSMKLGGGQSATWNARQFCRLGSLQRRCSVARDRAAETDQLADQIFRFGCIASP